MLTRASWTLLSLPTDLYFEIFSFLHPEHIFRLCQSSRHLAQFLTSSNLRDRLWRAARVNAGWHDPREIGVDNYTYLRVQYGRLCRECGINLELVECCATIWARPTRLCCACLDSSRISRQELIFRGDPLSRYAFLGESLNYLYKADILDHTPSPEELTALRKKYERLQDFSRRDQHIRQEILSRPETGFFAVLLRTRPRWFPNLITELRVVWGSIHIFEKSIGESTLKKIVEKYERDIISRRPEIIANVFYAECIDALLEFLDTPQETKIRKSREFRSAVRILCRMCFVVNDPAYVPPRDAFIALKLTEDMIHDILTEKRRKGRM